MAGPLSFASQGDAVVENRGEISRGVEEANRIGKEQVKLVLALVIGLQAVKRAHTVCRCGKRGVVYDMQDVPCMLRTDMDCRCAVATGANEGPFAFTAHATIGKWMTPPQKMMLPPTSRLIISKALVHCTRYPVESTESYGYRYLISNGQLANVHVLAVCVGHSNMTLTTRFASEPVYSTVLVLRVIGKSRVSARAILTAIDAARTSAIPKQASIPATSPNLPSAYCTTYICTYLLHRCTR